MDEEEDHIDEDFYRQLQAQLYGDIELASPLSETTVESVPTEESVDSFVCTCPWLDQADSSQIGEVGEVVLSASPSDILYETLVYHDNECADSDRGSSQDSRFTPDSDTENEASMVPFRIRWSLGFTINSRLVNLTKDNRKEFYMATAHKGIIYDYEKNHMRYVHGHIKPVKSASVDGSGHWLVTGGRGFRSKIIVSDTLKCKQLLILDNNPEDVGALILGMAPDARFFISVHNIDNPVIKVWRWTHGLQEPTFEWSVGKYVGSPCRIAFHPNDQNFFMIAFERHVVYTHWNMSKNVLDEFYSPTHKKLGTITNCTMALNKHETFVSTSTGHIAIFGNVLYTEDYSEHALNNMKIFVKKIKVCRSSIVDMQCVDEILVTLEEKGSLKFFDTNVLLLYWIEKELPPIAAMSFSLSNPRISIAKEPLNLRMTTSGRLNVDEVWDEEDRVAEYELLGKHAVRSRASLQHRPFICRDFVAGCIDGRVFHIDVTRGIFQPFFSISDSPIASICVSPCQPLLYVAYESGRVTIFDYNKLESLVTSTFLIKKSRRNVEETEICNSFILISNLDIHLVIARTNGEIIFLGPTLVPIPNRRYHYTNLNIDRMAFSENNQYLAFCDVAKTMYVLQFRNNVWEMNIKFRGHHSPITDMLFLHFQNPRLYTIGEDRYIVEYHLDNREEPLKLRVKIEETAIPLCFIYYPTPPNAEKYFLVANSEYKYKMISEKTLKCHSVTVGPCLGCYETPVNRMLILPNSHGKYIIFANHNHMGIQKTPPDGNPYKHIGALANPKLGLISLCNQGNYVFTYAKGEGGILIWEINKNCVDILHYLGGPELEPYYSLIEGGSNGWFFKEIEDLFCYMQILHQQDAYAMQKFTDTICISDLTTLVRACGYYPSEYEIQLLLDDIENRDFEKTGKKRETITFVEFVKLFVNHRPAYGIKMQELEKHFNTLFDNSESIEPQDFVKRICKYGETFTENTLYTCLETLMSNEMKTYGEDILDELEPITFEYFTKTMLGILQESAYTEAQERAIREAEAEENIS